MDNNLITIADLSKNYGERPAVSGLHFSVPRGEFFGLLGPNGAGKTTTIGMITGLIAPTKGQIIIDDQDFFANPRETKAKMGFVPQDFAFYPSLDAQDNLIFFGRVYGLFGKRLKQRIGDVLDIVDLYDCARQRVSTFSNGMKRRLNIAIGLLHEPQILILDEPTVGVDAHVRQAILETLNQLNKKGLTVVYTTHHMEEAHRLCHRIAIMDKGRIIALDSPSKLIEELGNGIIRVRFQGSVPESSIARLKQLAVMTIHETQDLQIHLETHDTGHVIREVLALSKSANLRIKSLDLLEPSLETVFLHLTGRSLKNG